MPLNALGMSGSDGPDGRTEAGGGERRRVLVILEGSPSDALRAGVADEGQTEFVVLPLGCSPARVQTLWEGGLPADRVSFLDPSPYVNEAEARLRAFVPVHLRRFPHQRDARGRSLLEILRTRDGKNLWWLCPISEKSPLRGRLLSRLYYVGIVTCAVPKAPTGPVWLSVQDAPLARCLQAGLMGMGLDVRMVPAARPGFWGRVRRRWPNLFQWVRLAALQGTVLTQAVAFRVALRLSGVLGASQSSGTPRDHVGLFTRYPALWVGPGLETPKERYFHHLEEHPSRPPIAYHAWLSPPILDLVRYAPRYRALVRSGRVHLLQTELTVHQIFSAFRAAEAVSRLVRYAQWAKTVPRAKFHGWDITELVHDDVREALAGGDIPRNLLLSASIRARVSGPHRPRVLVLPLEFQPMERAVWAACAGTVPTVALQHSTFCPNHLMYFFEEGELAVHRREGPPDGSPTPDYVLAAGSWPAAVLGSGGVSRDRLATVGAVRYDTLRLQPLADKEDVSRIRRRLGLPCDQRVVLVLTSQARGESMDLLATLAQVGPQLTDAPLFLLKSHYHSRLAPEFLELCRDWRPPLRSAVLPPDEDFHLVARAADQVLVGGTTAGVEVLALGHRPIVYLNPTTLGLSSLQRFPDAVRVVRNAVEMTTALQPRAGLPGEDGGFHEARARAVSELFHRLDGHAVDRMLAQLEEWGLVEWARLGGGL